MIEVQNSSLLVEDIIKNMLPLECLPQVNSKEWLSINSLENEVWTDIPGYEGLYRISCYGRILSLEKQIRRGKGAYKRGLKILKYKNTQRGYYKVILAHPILGSKTHFVHRLVAISFLGLEDGKDVNHKDENTRNPLLSNLEWLTHRQNCLYGNALNKIRNAFVENGISKAVALLSQSGTILKRYKSIIEAANDLNLNSTGIIRACKKHGKYDGLIFRYINDL